MATTLADVARKSGVSVGTVSRVLNGKVTSPIPAETIARIRRAAADLQYRPNPLARALITGRTHTLGLFSRETTDPHFSQMLEAVEARARALGYHLVVSSSLDGVSRPGRVDGTILLNRPDRLESETLPSGHPSVFVYNAESSAKGLVGWSDEEGMGLATGHLLELGHRRIAALLCYGENNREADYPKVNGFRRAVRGIAGVFRECWERSAPDPHGQADQYEDGYQAVRRLLDSGAPFTGIVARNDFIALGALRALRQGGLRVPQDVSVVGYTDSIQAVCADPPLTSVRTPIAQAGEIAVENLVRLLDDPEYDFPGVLLPTTLRIRESTAPTPVRS